MLGSNRWCHSKSTVERQSQGSSCRLNSMKKPLCYGGANIELQRGSPGLSDLYEAPVGSVLMLTLTMLDELTIGNAGCLRPAAPSRQRRAHEHVLKPNINPVLAGGTRRSSVETVPPALGCTSGDPVCYHSCLVQCLIKIKTTSQMCRCLEYQII